MSDPTAEQFEERANRLLDRLTSWANPDNDVLEFIGEAVRLARAKQATLDRINMLACYASEENTDAQPAALLEIGKLARGEQQP